MDSELAYKLEVLKMHLKFGVELIDKTLNRNWFDDRDMAHLDELFLVLVGQKGSVQNLQKIISKEIRERQNRAFNK